MNKFSKNRSVNDRYWAIPIKYCTEVPASRCKSFVVMDMMGKNVVCAWRNDNLCRVGRPFLCRLVVNNGKRGFIYKDRFYSLETKYGWVF